MLTVTGDRIASLVFETFLFALTLYKFYQSVAKYFGKQSVLYVFIRDGTWAFALIFGRKEYASRKVIMKGTKSRLCSLVVIRLHHRAVEYFWIASELKAVSYLKSSPKSFTTTYEFVGILKIARKLERRSS